MFGFLFGTACLVGLVLVVRGGRRHGWSHRRGWGRRRFYRLFERLDATPGQERELLLAFEGVQEAMRGARSELRDVRHGIAEALRGDKLGAEEAAGATAPFAKRFDAVRDAFERGLERIHGALDERQRRDLAAMIETGHAFGARHHHRHC